MTGHWAWLCVELGSDSLNREFRLPGRASGRGSTLVILVSLEARCQGYDLAAHSF